jgi:hypothetical protein
MFVIVAVNLCMAVEANWDRIRDAIITSILGGLDMIRFNLNPTKTVANAASPVASYQEHGNLVSVEWHVRSSLASLRLLTWPRPASLDAALELTHATRGENEIYREHLS